MNLELKPEFTEEDLKMAFIIGLFQFRTDDLSEAIQYVKDNDTANKAVKMIRACKAVS